MNSFDFCVVVPAIKKNVAFPNDLVKKLNGITLLQRTFNTAKQLTIDSDIIVITDSEEVTLMSKRNNLKCIYNSNIKFNSKDIITELEKYLIDVSRNFQYVVILFPYVPLIKSDLIHEGYETLKKSKSNLLITVKEESHRIYTQDKRTVHNLFQENTQNRMFVEQYAFIVINTDIFFKDKEIKILPLILNERVVEIRNYQDWWICEKLLERKKIVFRVVGYNKVGTGHIFRALTIAHEIVDHEIVFVCDEKSRIAVNKIAGEEYLVLKDKASNLEKVIISLQPDLVINDILDTDEEYIKKLEDNGIIVVNFEDLGSGAKYTNLTINDLYDEKLLEGDNFKWGNKYFFLRDEFNDARVNQFNTSVKEILITFGGTDPTDLTKIVFETIVDYCIDKNIIINIVVGIGYKYENKIKELFEKKSSSLIKFTRATGVISGIMEKSQIAISSNGRTVYELAHMNIPSIIISHHVRESNHGFSCHENGFINLGVYNEKIKKMIYSSFSKLVEDNKLRKTLFNNMKRFNFISNKENVIKMITNLLVK